MTISSRMLSVQELASERKWDFTQHLRGMSECGVICMTYNDDMQGTKADT